MSTIEQTHQDPAKKRPVSFTVRTDLIKEARALRLNTSRAAEAGIEAAVKAAKSAQWLVDNAEGIKAHNERVSREGMLITPPWLRD